MESKKELTAFAEDIKELDNIALLSELIFIVEKREHEKSSIAFKELSKKVTVIRREVTSRMAQFEQ